MSSLTEDQARAYMHKLLTAMAQAGGSDLFIAHDFPPSIKLNGGMKPLIAQKRQTHDGVTCAEDVYLRGDRAKVTQVLVNLLSNAIKACRADGTGRVAVLAWPAADVLLLCVEDNGRGISPAVQHLIFDKFFQAQNQTTRKPEGTGLGLAITRKIVELHHGRIWVESALEQGARFFVELPLRPA